MAMPSLVCPSGKHVIALFAAYLATKTWWESLTKKSSVALVRMTGQLSRATWWLHQLWRSWQVGNSREFCTHLCDHHLPHSTLLLPSPALTDTQIWAEQTRQLYFFRSTEIFGQCGLPVPSDAVCSLGWSRGNPDSAVPWSVQRQPATDCCYCSGAGKNGTATLHQHLCGVARNPPHMFYQANYQSRAVSVSKDSPASLGDNVQLFSQTRLEPSLQKQAESSPKASTRQTHKSEGTDGSSLTQLCCNYSEGSVPSLLPFPKKHLCFQSQHRFFSLAAAGFSFSSMAVSWCQLYPTTKRLGPSPTTETCSGRDEASKCRACKFVLGQFKRLY